MSNYRDDTQETAVAGASTWAGLSALTGDNARIASALLFGLLVVHADTATAAGEAFGSPAGTVIEQATAADLATGSLHGAALVTEKAKAGEQWRGALRVLHEDSAAAGDEEHSPLRSITAEQAVIADQVIAQRRVAMLVQESAKVAAISLQAAFVLVEDQAGAGDWTAGTLRAAALAQDAALAADLVLDGQRTGSPAADTARLAAEAFDHLAARDLLVDGAVAEDSAGGAGAGQAWTANVDTWAMSRYAPYTFTGVAVIDGQLYGTAEDGVYALAGGNEQIAGHIATGQLDLGRGALVHPLSAYLEYELDGVAEMDVTTTQSGAAETYTYTLPVESAGELTNGRFVFGRGLRGRHFSFTLRLTGTHGHINDLSAMVAPTKRRV